MYGQPHRHVGDSTIVSGIEVRDVTRMSALEGLPDLWFRIACAGN
jgi:hypothetical protein